MRTARLLALSLLLPTFIACSSDPSRGGNGGGNGGNNGNGDPDAGGSGSAIFLEPADSILPSDGKSPVRQAYTVRRDGEDVTGLASFSLDDGRLGSFQGNVFTSAPGAAGRTSVRASVDGATTHTSLTIAVSTVVVTPGTSPDAPQQFGGAADPAAAPEVVYPPEGVMLPPNVNEMEFQWKPAAGQDLFELSFVGGGIAVIVYTKCEVVADGCVYTPDDTTWKHISNGGRNQTLQVKVRGTSAGGGSVGSSVSRSMSFAAEDMLGGLYYWAANPGMIARYEFGRRGQKAETFYSNAQGGGVCVGCHALSRNGQRIAIGLNIPSPATMRSIDVATRTTEFTVGSALPVPGGAGSNFQAYTPDAKKLITTEGNGLTIRNADTGATIGNTPSLPNANMPDVSPDGKMVVFARDTMPCPIPALCPNLSTTAANLYTATFTGTAFGGLKPLVTGGGNNYYPAFSPDGQYVVFNRATGDSNDNPAATVLVVPTSGGGVIELPNVNQEVGNSWPKWAPFVHHFGPSTVMWFTFASRRPMGLRENIDPSTMAPPAQIWMAAFSPAKGEVGGDPSYPAFRLPFQDPKTGNHIAQWVEQIVRQECQPGIDQGPGSCMANEICDNGKCVPKIQ